MRVFTAKIGKVTNKITNWDTTKIEVDKEIEYIDITSIDRVTKIIIESKKVLASEAPSRARQIVTTNDVLISTVRPNLNAVALIPDELDGATASTGFTVLRSNNTDLDPKYLYYWVRSPFFVGEMVKRATGASYPAVTDQIVKDSKIPLPSLPEQKRIAAILDKADAIRRKRQETIRLADEFLRSVFLEMFGDPVRNEKGWDTYKGNDYSDLLTVGVVVKPASYYIDKGIVALRSLNIKPNHIILSNLVYFSEESSNGVLAKSILMQGDVVIVRTGLTGTAAVVPKELDGANCIDLIIVRPKKNMLNPYYLVFLLNSERGKKLVSSKEVGGIQKHFNIGAIRDISVPLPPMSLQDQFAQIVEKTEQQKELLEKSLVEMDNNFNSIMKKAFKAEL
jgi:type I restriction enzyme, S subunit